MSLAVVEKPLGSKNVDGVWFLLGHNSDVLSIATDGSDVFATCDAGGVGLLWKHNSSSYNESPLHVCGIRTGGPAILDSCFLNHTRLCTAQGDGNVGVWNVETAQCVHSICRTSGRGRSSDWSVINALTVLDGKLLAYGGDDGFLVLCDPLQNKILSTVNMRVPITSVVASSDSLFIGDVLGGIRCFDIRMLRNLYTLRNHRDVVSSLVLNDDATMLVSYGMDNLLTLWDVAPFALSANDRLLHRTNIHQGDSRKLLRCNWSKKGTILVPAGDGQVFRVNASMFEGVKMTLPVSHREGPAQCSVFLGDEVAVSCSGSEVILQPA
ncbi:putative U5 snRNP-specific 40 kDa protein [Trypanosoma theileri]|uniref:Putative U5 snRNP-specific 40 kDa protein n=1 Tax=Trypanosoma theileri TaxID=67003 RepID=A0A1X0NQJ3_9TRYP|nr:putative U5 snRNP-specific 40 kDa protein [Trypanosoma theileri]ORC86964.1 putative U5 snRNP-specific 40 kDa protein [Trypanosoma theileri]